MTIIFLAHNGNIPFIHNELQFLLKSDKVKRVKVFTDFPIEDLEVAFHDKCHVTVYGKGPNKVLNLNRPVIIVKELLSHAGWYLRRRKWKELFLFSRDHMKKARFILDNGIVDDAILYSFWAGSGAFIIACLKQIGLKNLAFTRLHGFDLYLYGNNEGHIPWRKFVFKNLDYLLPISFHGKKYLDRTYDYRYIEKTFPLYIGVKLNKNFLVNKTSEKINIVSCGWVGNHKNIKGIFTALRNQDNWKWSHIGDGEHYEELKSFVNQKSKLEVNLIGRLSQQEIGSYYSFSPITCFISLSPNEGLPVSMMEAMAFGIPVVSTDVGGCAEIVTPETGVLLPKNYTHEDVVNAVNTCAEKFSTPEARKRIQDFIRTNFDAEKNYQKFIDFLEAENKKHIALHL